MADFWNGLGDAISQASREQRHPHGPQTDPLRPYREAAYAAAAAAVTESTTRRQAGDHTATPVAVLGESMPWARRGWGHRPLASFSAEWLLGDMAEHAGDGTQLAAVFLCMDAARMLGGVPGATGRAGHVLIERVLGHITEPPLPFDWAARADHELRVSNSSGAYWAESMLVAAHKMVRPPDREGRRASPESGPVSGLV